MLGMRMAALSPAIAIIINLHSRKLWLPTDPLEPMLESAVYNWKSEKRCSQQHLFMSLKWYSYLAMIMCTCSPSTREAEAGGFATSLRSVCAVSKNQKARGWRDGSSVTRTSCSCRRSRDSA